MQNVNFDPELFDVDEYGNLYPKSNKTNTLTNEEWNQLMNSQCEGCPFRKTCMGNNE
jgi:radical SAM protein with 4Fe4S-binding SPASM domain